jgi:hypothetical protein
MKQFIGLVFVLGLVVVGAPSVFTQTMGQAERFSAGAIDINNGRAGRIEIDVDRWSRA